MKELRRTDILTESDENDYWRRWRQAERSGMRQTERTRFKMGNVVHWRGVLASIDVRCLQVGVVGGTDGETWGSAVHIGNKYS